MQLRTVLALVLTCAGAVATLTATALIAGGLVALLLGGLLAMALGVLLGIG